MKKFMLLLALFVSLSAEGMAQRKVYHSAFLSTIGVKIQQVTPIKNGKAGTTYYDNYGSYSIGREYRITSSDTSTRVYRTYFPFSLSSILSGATIDTVIVTYTNTETSGSLKLTKITSLAGDANSNWSIIGNSTACHTGLPYNNSQGFISDPIKTAMQSALSNGTLNIGAASENESTNGSNSGMVLNLEVRYYVTLKNLTVTVQNDLDSYGNAGQIGVGVYPDTARRYSSPKICYDAYETGKLNLKAYDNQLVYGRSFVFNDNEAPRNKSEWKEKRINGTSKSLGYVQSFTSDQLGTEDNNSTITALMKDNSVTNPGTLNKNETWWRDITLQGDIIIPQGIKLTLFKGMNLDLNSHSIVLRGGTLADSGANFTGLKAWIKTSSNVILRYCGSIQTACDSAASGHKVEIKSGSYNGGFSLNSKSDVTISGYGATINGTINLNNNSYCNLYGVYMPAGQVYISGGIGIIVMDVRSDLGNHSMNIQNTTNNAVYGLSATNGDMNDFGVNIYNSNGDICRSSRIENQMVGIYLYGTSSYNVTEDYFCNNGFDVDAEGGAYAYLLHNTYSRVHPISAYGNYFGPNLDSAHACSSASGLAKSSTASFSMNKQAEVKGTPAGDLDLMYLDLIHRTSQDTALDHKGRIEKYKSEYLNIAEKSKGEVKKSLLDLSKLKNSLSITANCLRYLGEEGSLSSYLNELLGMSDLQAYSPYIKKYFIPGLISRQDYAGALAQCDEVLKAKDIDKDLTCEMLYEKGIINRFYLNNNTEAYRAFSSITAKYPNHPLGKMAMGQISDMPGFEVEKPGLKSLGSNSEGFSCSSYPNPFNPTTKFTFSIPGDGFTELKIYNSLGQEVKTLVSNYLTKGKYTFEWNAGSYSSGIYYYFLKSGNNVTTSKIILLK